MPELSSAERPRSSFIPRAERSVTARSGGRAIADAAGTFDAGGERSATRAKRELPTAVMTGLALMCTLLWAGAQIGVKYALDVSPPFALMGFRFVAASLALLVPIFWVKSPWPASRLSWGRTVLLGVLNNTMYLGLTAFGLASVSAGLACVLAGLNPLMLAVGGAVFFRERVTPKSMLGLFGALCGVTFVMAGRLGSDNKLEGALILCAANVVMVAGNLLFKRWQQDCGLLVSHAVQLFVGGVTLLALSLMTESMATIQWGPKFFWSETFLVFGVSFGAMLTWLFLLSRGSAAKAGAFLFLVPLFGLGESALFLGEALSRRDVWGSFMTTLCIWYAQRSDGRAQSAH